MSVERNENCSNTEDQQIRHSLVDTAVNFLLNPAVIDKPNAHKIAFLKNKGLSDAEISVAYKKAENDPKFKELQENEFSKQPVLPSIPAYESLLFWSKLKNISSSLILLGVALFGAHYVYKKYIEPLIFKPVPVSKAFHLEEQLSEVIKSLSLLENNISTLQKSMKKLSKKMDEFFKEQNSYNNPIRLALKEMKTDIATVKISLIRGQQFPAYPAISPTIPAWQLSTKKDANDTAKKDAEMNEHKDHNISEDSSRSEIQLEQNDEDAIKKKSGAKENAEIDEHKDHYISKVSSTSEIQFKQNDEDTVKENSGDAIKKNCATVDLENEVSTQSLQKQFSEELNVSPIHETISSISESSEKLKNVPIPDAISNA